MSDEVEVVPVVDPVVPEPETPAAEPEAPKHGLSHLEEEFLAVWDALKDDAKAVLAWVASKL